MAQYGNPIGTTTRPIELSSNIKSWYGLEDAMLPITYSKHGAEVLQIFDFGCQLSNEMKDCQTVCQDPDLMFLDLYRMHNCLAYVYMSFGNQVALSERDLDVVTYFYGTNVNDTQLIDKVNSTISTCFAAYCEPSDDICRLEWEDGYDFYLNRKRNKHYSVSRCPEACEKVSRIVSSDIVGIGVREDH
jgi:hypothetical protein